MQSYMKQQVFLMDGVTLAVLDVDNSTSFVTHQVATQLPDRIKALCDAQDTPGLPSCKVRHMAELVVDLKYTSTIKATAVKINKKGDFVAVIDDKLFFNGERVAKDAIHYDYTFVQATAVDINEAGQWVIVVDDRVIVSPGNCVLNLGYQAVVESVSCSINESGQWVAVIDDKIYRGRASD